MIKKIMFIQLFMLLAVPLLSQEKMRLAVLDLEPKDVSKVIASSVSDLLRTEIVDTGSFIVVERGQMNAILKEQGLQNTGCTDSACAVQVGKLLSAKKILIGEVNQIGAGIIITARVVDVEKGVAEFASSEKAENLNGIDKAARRLAGKLAERITGKRTTMSVSEESSKSTSGYYLRGIIPGWGQFYAKRPVWGYVYLGSFAVSGSFLLYTTFAFFDKKSDYDDLGDSATWDDFSSKRTAYKDAARNVNIALGIFGFVYLWNWVDLILFKPDFNSSNASTTNLYFMDIAMIQGLHSRDGHENIYSFSYGMRY